MKVTPGLRSGDAPATISTMGDDGRGLLPAFAAGTLILFYLVWAAMHDIAHGDEGTLEWTCLAISVPAFAFLSRQALRRLRSASRLAWLIGTDLLLSLFLAGAANAILDPKYPKDPLLAEVFLAVGVPALALLGYRLVREALHRDARSGS